MRSTNELNIRSERVIDQTTTVTELVDEVNNAVMVEVAMTENLEGFLADPIGYGEFDYSDPITLTDFEMSRIMHGRYVEALT